MSKLLTALTVALAIPAAASAQWTPLKSGTNAEIRGLVAVSPNVVWASGTRARVMRTTDGGATWTVDTLPFDSRVDLRDIHASSATRAWAMSLPDTAGSSHIYHTEDGKHWTQQLATSEKGAFLDAISFSDDRHGLAVGDALGNRVYFLRTDDGGATWKRVDSAATPAAQPKEGSFAASGTNIAMIGNSLAWIATGATQKARVFRTTDGGRSWSVADTPMHAGDEASGIFSITFTDAQHGVVVGGDYRKPKGLFDNVALTSDGGRTWRLPKGKLPQGFMSCVAYIPETKGRSLVAVGLGGTARSDDGGESWRMIDSVAYNSVAFASRDAGWAAGPQGRIAKWTPSPRVSER